MKTQNAAMLAGKVLEADEASAVIETYAQTRNGEVSERHQLQLPEGVRLAAGKFMKVLGSLAANGAVIVTGPPEKSRKDESCNIAKLVGLNPWPYQIIDGDASKIPLANFGIQVSEDTVLRTVVFGSEARNLKKRGAGRGAVFEVFGSLRHRDYVDRQTGEPRVAHEVVCDPERIKLLKVAAHEDPFGDVGAGEITGDPSAPGPDDDRVPF